nr:hypothetical protein [Tanacetum cinerariifolium]
MPSTISNEGTVKTTPLPEGTLGDKDSKRNKPPVDMEQINPTVVDLSWSGAKYQVDETQSTRLMYRSLTENKGKTFFEVDPDTKPLQLKTFVDVQAFLISKDEMAQEIMMRKNMTTFFHSLKGSWSSISGRSLKLFSTKLLKNSGHSMKKLLSCMLTSRPPLKDYYEENVDHMDQTDKVIDAAMNSLDKNSIARGDLLNALNRVTKTLKGIQDAIKEDHVLNKKMIEATEAYTKNSTHLTELFTLITNFDFQGLKSLVESSQATALS